MLAALVDEPQLVLSCYLEPEQLPDLVEYNPTVAAEVRSGLAARDQQDI